MKVREIIEFAINKEIEAIEFHKKLQNIAKLQSSKAFLKELEEMEVSHKNILQNYLDNPSEISLIEQPTNLQISDFMDDVEAESDITFQQILIIAMKREERAMSLYQQLAAQVEGEARNVFIRLSQEEAKHKLQLETIYDEEILKEN
ncbi:MAG TPA: ferritin family protein [Candidatus Kapabacteria bacterium]|nr:ferritin family protein [Candidatus Kapabacteria bacterium]